MENVKSRFVALLAAAAFVAAGCNGKDGKDGANGQNGQNGASTGTVSGKVTVAGVTPAVPLSGVAVGVSPAVAGVTVTTNATGDYTATLPVGVYSLTFSAANFTAQTKSVSVLAAQATTQNVALAATAPVLVSIAVNGTAAPGATVSATATVLPLDGSTVTTSSYAWSQPATNGGAPAAIATPNALTTTLTLAGLPVYKTELFKALTVSPIQDLDDDPAVGGEGGTPFLGGLQDRFKVQAINHFDVERAGEVTVRFTVTTSSGTYTASKLLVTARPWKPAQGVPQVPVGEAVVLHGKAQASWAYTLTRPAGSAAVLDEPTGQNPAFVADVAGTYTVAESVSGLSIDVVAGNWAGAIDAAATLANLSAAGAGTPVGSATCTACHSPGSALDKFTPWAKSGHASIFTQNVNAGGHYGEACFDCHMVGWNKSVTNQGIDEKADYAAMLAAIFTVAGSPPANPLNWKTILTNYPATAAMSNIQCENCHGPQGTHTRDAAEKARRVSLDSGVCARCHGEPARHGRYQEWQLSRHSNYGTAIGESFDAAGAIRNSCAGCHSAQGFLLWSAQLKGGNASRNLTAANVLALTGAMTPSNVEPQTCATCHDPHDAGTVSSLGTDAKLRVENDTPMLPSGFKALGVGKGALCITCHNSRNGESPSGSGNVFLHEDGGAPFGTLTAYSGPHEACQGDVLMGRNAYFVNGVRGAHSNIKNTCVACHMESVPAPAELAYPTQSNHIFEANLSICAKCHGELDGSALQSSVEAELADLKAAIEGAVKRVYAPTATSVVYASGRAPTISINGAAAVAMATVVCTPVAPATTCTGGAANNPINTDLFAKANWNYSLIEQDFSRGVHNPAFAHEVLFRTIQRVNAIVAAQ
jgi:hypothetical protein